jgi:hypothetical protein
MINNLFDAIRVHFHEALLTHYPKVLNSMKQWQKHFFVVIPTTQPTRPKPTPRRCKELNATRDHQPDNFSRLDNQF